jgi:hypothetical protein
LSVHQKMIVDTIGPAYDNVRLSCRRGAGDDGKTNGTGVREARSVVGIGIRKSELERRVYHARTVEFEDRFPNTDTDLRKTTPVEMEQKREDS